MSGRGGGIRTPTRGFGDRWSAVKPTPLHERSLPSVYRTDWPQKTRGCPTKPALLGLPVRLVLPAVRTELLQLDALGSGFLVLGFRIVTILALSALKRDDLSGHS